MTGSLADFGKFLYNVNGRNIFLRFDELDYNPALCAFESDVKTPLTGNNPTFPSEIVTAYGSGILFAPIGLDFLYTSVTKPQVVVDIDGLAALCVNLNCDYSYVASTSQVTQQTYNPSTKVLTVTGTALPTTGVTLNFNGVTCATLPAPTFTNTQIQCTLANTPKAGSIKVELRTDQGLIPVSQSVTAITVPLVVSAVSPTSINPMGGNTLTITGSGFPIDKAFVTVSLSDGAKCVVTSTTETQIKCQLEKTTAKTSSSVTVTILNFDYYDQSTVPVTDNSKTVNIIGGPKVTAIDKSNVSPVIKQTLQFTVTGYTDTLLANQLQVTCKGPNGYSRSLYVMSVDDTLKTITVKFNGAPIAQYTFEILSTSPSSYGLLDTSAISFQTSSTVTGLTPTSGSVLGGTLITITGTNFSTTIEDQVVSLVVSQAKSIYCDILTATATQLQCRVRKTNLDPNTPIANVDLVVVLAASSQATCPNNNCKFSFNAPVASITSLTPGYDAATKSITYTLAGTGFTAGDTSSVSLYVDGVKQTTASVGSTTSAVFRITDVQNTSSSNVAIYFADGSPTGYTLITQLTFAQKFTEVTPTSGGSEGGTLLTVKGTGFGLKTTGLGLKNVNTSTSICKEVKVTGYGTFTCLTNQTPVQASDQIKMLLNTNEIACETSTCSFAQLRASSPEVIAASLTGITISFTGTAFPAEADYTAVAYFKSASVAVTGWSSTSATATFAKGVPAASASENAVPRLQFTRKADSVILVAYSTGVTLTNAVTVLASDSTSGLTSSFAGGLSYTIAKANVYASLLEAGNSITVCGNVCPLDATQSDSTKAVCILPKLATTYSASTYQITQTGPIEGTWTAQVPNQAAYLTDNIWPTEYTDPGTNCFIEVTFPDQQVGVLDSVKILINNLDPTKMPFSGVTRLLGFNGKGYDPILTLDSSIHEGWNTFEWTTNKPAYQKYKWMGTKAGSCRFAEIKYFGILAKTDTATQTSCVPKLTIGGTSVDLNSVTYSNTATPTISTLSQRYGKVSGGELLTITGTNFVTGSTTVTIDTIPCVVQSSSTTQIQCTLGKRPGDQPNPSLAVFVGGKGLAANQGNTFRYVQYWSEPSTWGGDAPPQFGEAVSIPVGRTLLVDVDAVPQLSFVLVEGSLIFAPHPTDASKERTFDAGYIFINGGYMEVGTEQNPYTSKITITMHGDANTPAIPVYGNKNIAVRKGELHLVGKERKVTWTMLDSTALASATQITLMSQAAGTFDWAVGEEIVIASTSYNHAESETRRITAVSQDAADPTKPVLTLDSPLKYKHFAKTVNVGTGGDFIDMRAEVGLLTRNVKYQGDPETSPKNQYGAHIMLHYPMDESCIGRILYTELFNVGQAFKLGRYPIHFHVIGTVSKSLVKGNAIHQTYNRAVTIHNVKYFNVVQNVIYNTMGHSIFIEDAIETKNVIDRNLVVSTRSSFSLLNTDQTPASFWITHPDNVFTNNHAAGSERYGFWFDLQDNSINGSYSPSICPKNSKLGEFRDNVAHSNGKYGLRIFHSLAPRERPCDAWTFDNSNPTANGAPYPSNPSIPAVFENFVSWSNLEVGAIAESTGAVEWRNFKMADNGVSQMEWSTLNSEVKATNISLVNKALIIGRTENGVPGSTYGIIGPRSNFFTINDVKFFNIDATGGALGDCSHCEIKYSTDSGARTYFTSKLSFDASVKRKILYRYPYRGIYSDLDGTLTGLGAGSWATAYFKHNDWPGQCTYDDPVYNGHICNSSVQVRRVAFYNMTPAGFQFTSIKILQYDQAIVGPMSQNQLSTYKTTDANYSSVPMKFKTDPMSAWCLPYVTGHKYRVYWDMGQLDYRTMNVDLDAPWLSTDSSIVFQIPLISNYEKIDFLAGTTLQAPGSLINPDVPDQSWITGFNKWDNTSKEVNFVVNAHIGSSLQLKSSTVQCSNTSAAGCSASTTPITVVASSCTGTPLLWSNAATWVTETNPLGGVPLAGQDVTIPTGANIVFDLAESPVLGKIVIQGCLQFLADNSKDQHLHAYHVYVFGGKFAIGAPDSPYTKKAIITLYGDQFSPAVSLDTEQNTKAISNIGLVSFYGKSRTLMARLQAEVQKGTTNLTVDKGLDWLAGDAVGIAATASFHTHSEEAIIKSYDSTTGALVLTAGLKYYHFGAAASTDFSGLDLRGEVFLLSRNILIEGDVTQNKWNGIFTTTDLTIIDNNKQLKKYSGIVHLENVEFKNMGPANTPKAALNFWNSLRPDTETEFSTINGVSIHQCASWGIRIQSSQNISFKDSIVFGATQVGVNMISARQIIGSNTNIIGVVSRTGLEITDATREAEGCIFACTFSEVDTCTRITWQNSIIAGCPFVGIKIPGYSCNDNVGDSKTNKFVNNVIHSVNNFGIWLKTDNGDPTTATCLQISDNKAAKCQVAGLGMHVETNEIRVSNMVTVDNGSGLVVNIGLESDTDKKILIQNSFIYGDSPQVPKDCPGGPTLLNTDDCYCDEKVGLLAPIGTSGISTKCPTQIKFGANWATRVDIKNVNFINFRSTTTSCGAKQSVIAIQHTAPDHIPVQYFTAPKFTNVVFDSLISIYEPPTAWAQISMCGSFPCTGPLNTVFNFYDAVFESPQNVIPLPSFWKAGTTTKYSFQVVSNAQKVVNTYPNATLNPAWNGWLVADPVQTNPFQIGQLYFESLDDASIRRAVQPVTIENSDGYSNVLNAFMDHAWDGFYKSQNRQMRFPAQVLTNKAYTITFNGSPPNNIRFKLASDVGTKGILIKIPYPSSGSVSVKVNGNIVDPIAFSATIDMTSASTVCGSNRYVGLQNFLEFYLTPGCTAYVIPRDAVLCNVRLQWTLSEFFASGETTFTQRLANVLGIHISRVKVVAAYEGSLNLQIVIQDDPSQQTTNADGSVTTTPAQLQQLQTLSNTLVAKVAADANVLGAPVLEIQNVVKTSVVVNTVIAPDAVIQMQQGGALQNFVLSTVALLLSTVALLV